MIFNNTFDDNRASYGYGGSAVITGVFNGTVENNTFNYGGSYGGAGLLLLNCDLDIKKSNSFYNNSVLYYGGAILSVGTSKLRNDYPGIDTNYAM